MTTIRRVAIAGHDLYPYGAQRVTLALVETFAESFGIESEVVSLGAGPLAVEIRRRAPVHMLGTRWNEARRDPVPVVHAMRRRGCRHAIVNTTVSGAMAAAFRHSDFTIVALIHELPGIIRDNHIVDRLHAVHAHAHLVVYPDDQARRENEAAFGPLPGDARIVVMPQGLTRRTAWRDRPHEARERIARALDVSAELPLVIGMGYGDERKGLDLFLEVARVCNESMRRPCLFAWIGPVALGYEATLAALGWHTDALPPYVRLPGFIDDPAPWFRAADVFALTSREDPFPNVVLESMDAGVPVIAFDGSGGGASLAASVAGRVAPAFDTAAFARAVVELLDDAEGRRVIGAAAQATVDARHSMRTYADSLLQLLEQHGGTGAA